jgi:hypothetical protein
MLVVARLLEFGCLGGGAFLLRDHHVLSLVALPSLVTLAFACLAYGVGTFPWIVALAGAIVT